MAEDRKRNDHFDDRETGEDMNVAGRLQGSALIFVLIAIALILAVAFFYLTKEDARQPEEILTEGPNSAAYIVGQGARDAADTLRNRN